MPEEIVPAAVWLVNKLTSDLQSAKMWPVKLQGVKYQDALSNLAQFTSTCWNSECGSDDKLRTGCSVCMPRQQHGGAC